MGDDNKNERSSSSATKTTTVQYETNPVNVVELERVVRIETVQQDVLRRISLIEQRTIDALPGAADKIRLIAADMLRQTESRLMSLENRRIGTIEGAEERIRVLVAEKVKPIEDLLTEQRKNHTRLMWIVMVSLAGQILRFVGTGSIADLLK